MKDFTLYCSICGEKQVDRVGNMVECICYSNVRVPNKVIQAVLNLVSYKELPTLILEDLEKLLKEDV